MSDLVTLSDDQSEAYDAVADLLGSTGLDLISGDLGSVGAVQRTISVIGKAGSGKTLLLAQLVKDLKAAGLATAGGEYEARSKKSPRSFAVLAPTNKAASVLRHRGVPATTLHRIIYTPVYDPEYEKIAEWLTDGGDAPQIEELDQVALDHIQRFYDETESVIGALTAVGLKGSDFITGWKRRDDPLDIGFVDEASMLDTRQLEDLKEIFSTLVLFGDPAQLAPVNQSGSLVFETLPDDHIYRLSRVHRQTQDNPILDLAHSLADPTLDFQDFEDQISQIAKQDDRVIWAERVNVDLISRSPVLVWRNATRIRLINAYRAAYEASETELIPGEPMICDGIELSPKNRAKRIDLEARGLVKGAQVVYLGPGKKRAFSRLHIIGAEDPRVSAASIIKIEKPDDEDPFVPYAAQQGAIFLHGAAVTIHKAQGSQWENVQVFAPDIYAAARAGRVEAGQPLWKRLAYVAITRAQERLYWVVRNRLSLPTQPLSTDDLKAPAPKFELSAQDDLMPPQS